MKGPRLIYFGRGPFFVDMTILLTIAFAIVAAMAIGLGKSRGKYRRKCRMLRLQVEDFRLSRNGMAKLHDGLVRELIDRRIGELKCGKFEFFSE